MLTLAAPWLLLAGLALPLVWWLIRTASQTEERQVFPPLDLLRRLAPPYHAPPLRRPWWLLVLRLGWLACLCLLAAHPQWMESGSALPDGPVLIVMDDGWASAADWQNRLNGLHTIVDRAERQGLPVALQTTAPGWDGQPSPLSGPMSATALRPLLAGLEPKPWPTRRQAILPVLEQETQGSVVWISDGLADEGSDALLALGRRLVLLRGTGEGRRLLGIERRGAEDWVLGADPGTEVDVLDEQGLVLLRQSVDQPLALDGTLRNRVRRIQISGERSAAATVWLDGGWQRPQVGLVDDTAAPSPLLADAHYLAQALDGWADLRRGKLESVLRESVSVLLLPDQSPFPEVQRQALLDWVRAGGVLIRFAGPHLAEGHLLPADPLLPVPLRSGLRWLGGSLSWTQPLALGRFSGQGPLAGLEAPPDVTVRRHLLADPSQGQDGRIWAGLQDGTPLVTGRPEGRGTVVLVHVAAHPGWSNLPLSGLWLEMLHRLVALGQPVLPGPRPSGSGGDELLPGQIVDGFGELRPLPQPPPPTIVAGQRLAGLYETGMVNLGPLLPPIRPLPAIGPLPGQTAGLSLDDWQASAGIWDLRPPLMVLAALLWLADLLLRLPRPPPIRRTLSHARAGRWLGMGLCLSIFGPWGIAGAETPLRLAVWQPAPHVADGTLEGLDRLSQVVRQRSSVRLDKPLLLTRLDESLLACPLLYWPLDTMTPRLSAADVDRLNQYMQVGGLLVIGGVRGEPQQLLQNLAPGLRLPPLRRVDQNHVVARTFYLLRDDVLPLAHSTILAADPAPDSDGTSALIVTDALLSDHWQQQGDRSGWFRLGVNLVLYALTGTYKADQVHIPAMLERLGR